MHCITRIVVPALCLVISLPTYSQEIDEILVTAVRRAVVEDQLSLSLSEFDARESGRHAIATDALANATGVHLQQTAPGQGAAIIRGQKGSAVLHLVDGMRLNNAIFRSAPTQYLALVPTMAIERGEVLRGTPTSLYGSDAIGGVVQLIMHRPEFDSQQLTAVGEVLIAASTAERAKRLGATLDAGTNRFATSISAEYADVGDRRVGDGQTVKPSAYETRAARWLLAAKPDESTELSLDLHYFEQPRTPRTDELVAGFGQGEPSSSEFWFRPNRRIFAHWDLQKHGGPLDLDWNIDLAWQRVDDDRQTRDYLAPERTIERNRSDLYGLTISASRLTQRGSWIAGVDLYHDEVTSRRVTEDLATGLRIEQVPRFPDGSSMQLLSAYANSTWAVGERHAITVGVRLSDDRTRIPGTQIHNTELSGDIGWVATLNDRWQFTSNLGYGFRAPNVFDVGTLGNRPGNRFNIPNPGLDSEHVVHADVGLRSRSVRTSFEVVVFALRYRDRITSVATGSITPEGREITQSVNAATADVQGAEMSLETALSERWTLSGNLTYTHGVQRIRGQGSEPGDRIPPLNGLVRFEYDPGGNWQVGAWAKYAASQSRLSDRDIGDTRIDPDGTPGWASFGVRAIWRPTGAWTLQLELRNVFDASYRVHGSGIDAVGRNLAFSARRHWR